VVGIAVKCRVVACILKESNPLVFSIYLYPTGFRRGLTSQGFVRSHEVVVYLIAFEDDASNKILSIGEFNNSTTDNALEVLKIAEHEIIEVNVLIQVINTDRGTQFYPNKKNKNSEADSVFRDYLE
jgi:hypothetical protein